MNITQEMMSELDALIYWYTGLDGTGLNVPQLVENHLTTLKELKEAYEYILLLNQIVKSNTGTLKIVNDLMKSELR